MTEDVSRRDFMKMLGSVSLASLGLSLLPFNVPSLGRILPSNKNTRVAMKDENENEIDRIPVGRPSS